MNVKELKEMLNDAKTSKKALLTKAVEETRSMNVEENDELRSLNDKISDLQEQIKKAEEELRANTIEEKIENKGEIKMNKEELELRSIEQFIKEGVVAEEIRATQTSAMNTAIQPTYIDNEIVKRLEEVAPVFAKAKMYPSVAGELKVPREAEANLYECGFVGEDAEVPEKAFSFDTISLKSVRVGAYVKVTQQLLNDVDKLY